ncbi:MAG: lipoyl(octanoyl) transferase LipB [Kangiellaceae bacterium]|nr:lipoyl(octanoyl) transferase LipB [Kangiellaceae bacterium]
MISITNQCKFRNLGLTDYQSVWKEMQEFTQQRNEQTIDEIWFVEHSPVFTQGQAGKEEHLLMPGDIPVVQADRGGQVTYHGPGQQVVYFLVDLKRKKMGVRQLVTAIENIVIELLAFYNICSSAKSDAPGVYVEEKKICSLGLKIKRGCSFHGLALNVNMDLEPFSRINPCGYAGLEITQVSEFNNAKSMDNIISDFKKIILTQLNYE